MAERFEQSFVGNSTFEPVRLLEIELGKPLPTLSLHDSTTGRHYHQVRALVRLHTVPLGLVDLYLKENDLTEEECATSIWQALHEAINDHLRQDSLPEISKLDAAGLSYPENPCCLHERTKILESSPFISIVISTRERAEHLATCLPHLLSLDYPNYEIIIVDNAPKTSATADLIAHHYAHLPKVRYVREDQPGLSRGRNRGLSIARGEIVAITDDDVKPDPHWLSEIAQGFSLGENVACVTGPILAAELETPAQFLIEQFGGFNKGFSERIFDMAKHKPTDRLYPYAAGMFGSGANISFKTSILRDIGGFDPALGAGSLGQGGEDLAAFVQLLSKGYQIVYKPGAFIYHTHHKEYSTLRKQLYSYGVGLTAYLTKCVLDDPKRLIDFGTKLPHGLTYALSSNSPKNRGKKLGYPAELTALELRGMLYGPVAYLRSCWYLRRTLINNAPLHTSSSVSQER